MILVKKYNILNSSPLLLIIIFITTIIITIIIIIIIIIWCSGHIRYWERRLFILLPSNTHLDYMSATHTWYLSHICHVRYLHNICHTWYLSDICHIWYLHDICQTISLPIHIAIIWALPISDICLVIWSSSKNSSKFGFIVDPKVHWEKVLSCVMWTLGKLKIKCQHPSVQWKNGIFWWTTC